MRPSVVVVAGLLASASCSPPPELRAHSAILPLTGPCSPDASGGTEFTSEAQSLRLTVNAKDMPSPVEANGDLGEITIEEVPAGADRVVALFGLVGSAAAWRGVTRGVTVTPNETSSVDVLMARIADLTCARSGDDAPRAFHTATVLDSGQVLLVGGANLNADASASCGGCRRLEATSSAALYDPKTGAFRAVAPLASARMFHVAAKLADGRVVVAGGTREALVQPIDAAHPFPIVPTAPVNTVEVFDPESLTFAAAGADPGGNRVFAAAAPLSTGEVILTGGIPSLGTPRHDLSNAVDTTTVCGGSPVSCRVGPQMASRRAGHAAFFIEPDGVYLWGGSVDNDAPGGIAAFQIEALRSGGFELLNVAAMSAARNTFFAAVTQYLDFRVLAAGGLVRAPDGSFDFATVSVGGVTRGAVYVYDASFDVAGGIAVGPQDGEAMHLTLPRIFAAAAPLTGGDRALIGGGYSDLSFTPSNALELYDEGSLTVLPITVGGTPRTLRQSRGGLAATANGDGTVVWFGGEAADAAGRVPLATAEIFADPQPPPEVAQ